MIFDFKNFYLLFLDNHMVQGTSVFSTVLVMSAFQNETLKN